VDRSQHLAAIEDGTAAFYAAAATAGLEAPVPSCPEWTVEDLVYHLGSTHRFWGQIASRRLQSPNHVEGAPRPPADELVDWARAASADLLASLTELDPATEVWTWSTQHDVAFIVRRMAHETAVHAWDAQLAAGQPQPIEPELASDGVDEFLTVFLVAPRFSSKPLAGSVHLHATDTPGEWLVRQEDDGTLVVTAEHAKGDAALRGPASQLLLALWGRVGLDELDVIGDRAAAEHLLARTTI
jgi:uncharacterized protein (TIGR03083 family)